MKKKKNNNWIVGLFILVLVGILVLLINITPIREIIIKYIYNLKKNVYY